MVDAVKLVSYVTGPTSHLRAGVLLDDGVHDAGFDGDMTALIEQWAERRDDVHRTATASAPVAGTRLRAPLRPRSMRDFMSFEGHFKRAMARLGREIPPEWHTVPAYYKGMPDTVIGPDEEIPWPAYSDRLDHELELAAVIGPPGKDIAPESALEHVFGWTIWNDLSARDTQAKELVIGMGPGKAKDWDGSNILGPCLVTADELDASDLRMTVRVNGEVWGEDRSSGMHHSFATLIAYASRAQTLHPGDLLGSGTAAGGSGMELDRWLQPGDLIEMEIEGIGTLRNRVGPHDTAS
jgi:2-keto-4-pentenoate hydratase/2-oxohepta-3-ene-1,7-dioic acid hydratase in catechol pathway